RENSQTEAVEGTPLRYRPEGPQMRAAKVDARGPRKARISLYVCCWTLVSAQRGVNHAPISLPETVRAAKPRCFGSDARLSCERSSRLRVPKSKHRNSWRRDPVLLTGCDHQRQSSDAESQLCSSAPDNGVGPARRIYSWHQGDGLEHSDRYRQSET